MFYNPIVKKYDSSVLSLISYVSNFYRYSKLPQRLNFNTMRRFLFSNLNGNPYTSGFYKTITDAVLPVIVHPSIEGGTDASKILIGGKLYTHDYWQETYGIDYESEKT